jgi:uncharacterized protein (TIGR02611 family)
MRLAKIGAGFGLLFIGIVMLALPGPGWLTIAAGLAILAGEFRWARRLLDQLKDVANRVGRTLTLGRFRRADTDEPDRTNQH